MKAKASIRKPASAENQTENTPVWIQSVANGCRIRVHVTPRASKTEIAGVHGDALAVRLQAPPVDGKANQALCAFFAERVGVQKRAVHVVSGNTSREKVLSVAGTEVADVIEKLGSF